LSSTTSTLKYPKNLHTKPTTFGHQPKAHISNHSHTQSSNLNRIKNIKKVGESFLFPFSNLDLVKFIIVFWKPSPYLRRGRKRISKNVKIFENGVFLNSGTVVLPSATMSESEKKKGGEDWFLESRGYSLSLETVKENNNDFVLSFFQKNPL